MGEALRRPWRQRRQRILHRRELGWIDGLRNGRERWRAGRRRLRHAGLQRLQRGKLWVRRYGGPVNRDDRASSLVASSDGSKVFVTGVSNGGDASIGDFATVAYDAPTGKMLWVSRYDGPG